MIKVVYQPNFIYYVLSKDTTEDQIYYIRQDKRYRFGELYSLKEMMDRPHISVEDCYLWSSKDMPQATYYSTDDIKKLLGGTNND